MPILHSTKSANYPNPKKYKGDRAKPEVFRAKVNLKLKRNANHFMRDKQDIEKNKLGYIISRFEGDLWAQIEPHVFADKIDFRSVEQLMDFLEIRFGEVDLVEMAKHELYRLYQTNKDLEVFLNTFIQLEKKARIDHSQALDILNVKLSNEFKDCFVTIKKVDNLNNFITSLRDIDTNVKRIIT